MTYPIENINITGGYTESHKAIDLGWTNTKTEELLACADGIVEDVYTIKTGGNTILINYQNGYKSYFMHCSKIIVSKGQKVSKKQLVAYMGMTGTEVTGPHCHFILTLNGIRVNPIEHCYIEKWQKISDRTKNYPVMYEKEDNVIEESEVIDEPKEENTEKIDINDFKDSIENVNYCMKLLKNLKNIVIRIIRYIKIFIKKII